MTPTIPKYILAALVFGLTCARLAAMPVISEFLAISNGVTPDEDGDASDWIEIFNLSTEPVSLEGYTLTDDVENPSKWTIPAVTMEPQGFFLIFASGKDRVDPAGVLHTNFSLDGGGEYLALYAPGEADPVSSFGLMYPDQRKGFSYGISGLVEGEQGYLLTPTPLAPNDATFSDFVADTKFSVHRGFFKEPVTLEITTATEGAEIRYTVDGTEPTADNGVLYTEPVVIETTSTLQAVAYKEGSISSNVDVQSYIFPADVKAQASMDSRVTEDPAYRDEVETALGETLPAVSIVVAPEAMFGPEGIYTNFFASGRFAEVPISLEYFSPTDPDDQFQIEAGVRIHGGNARSHPKKPLRLYFREEYSGGSGELEHALFGDSTVKSFEQLLLRGGGHDSWSLADTFGSANSDIPPHGTLLRDQFLRRTEKELGMLTPLGKYVHVYINGTYWGVYDLHERPNAAFFSDHLGGSKGDWDVIHHPETFDVPFTVVNGDSEAWEAMQSIAGGQVADETGFERMEDLVNLDTYVDSMIVRMWAGDFDWCGPVLLATNFNGETAFRNVTVFGNKNWYAGRQSRNGGSHPKFHFFTWDAEMSMGTHLLANLFGFANAPQRELDFDLSRASDPGSPVAPYDALIRYPPFQRAISDRLSKHLFNEGALSPVTAKARLQEMIDELSTAMVAESARWGNTSVNGTLFTRDDHWLPEVEWLRDVFVEARPEAVLAGFRARGVYPVPPSPLLSQVGGRLEEGQGVTITAPGVLGGDVYYTTDGTDPADLPEIDLLQVMNPQAPCIWIVPNASNGALNPSFVWNQPSGVPNEARWITGRIGLGFEKGDQNFKTFINKKGNNFDVGEVMGLAKNPGFYCRVPFTIPSRAALNNLDALILRVRYDDGFVAYINGRRVASANAPPDGTVGPRSTALAERLDEDAIIEEAFDVTEGARQVLQVGSNILAIHAMNVSLEDSDILMAPRMELRQIVSPGGPSASSIKAGNSIVLGDSGLVKARVLDRFGRWSALSEAYFQFEPELKPGDLALSEIHYRPSAPTTESELAVSDSRSAFEFVELRNQLDRAIELQGAAFTRGIRFTFPQTRLAPGERVVVVGNEEAFAARYGVESGVRVAGAFAMDSKLSDEGETLELVSKEGEVLLSFSYNDKDPWPESADGDGYSLVYSPGSANSDPADASQWSASLDPNGSPGTGGFTNYGDWQSAYFAADAEDTISGSEADPDGDGLVNLLEYLFGSHPLRPSEKTDFMSFATTVLEGEETPQLVFRFLRRPDMEDVTYAVEVSDDLNTWTLTDISEEDLLIEPNVSDRERASVIVMPPTSAHLFGRLRATLGAPVAE